MAGKELASQFVDSLRARCLQAPGAFGLPESDDVRVLAAAEDLLSSGVARQVAFFKPKALVWPIAEKNGIDLSPHAAKIEWFASPTSSPSPLHAAGERLARGELDVVLAGATTTTADVIRAAISTVGLAPGLRTISGSFLLNRERPGDVPQTILYADAGVVIEPTVPQLVDIAAASVGTWRCAVGDTVPPIVAFLSFSTAGSAVHASATKMAEAARLFRERHPQVVAEGELQFDAAVDREIGARKFPGNRIDGRANCFIFPSLDAGNIAYKITQRLGGFDAFGPILQGAGKAFSDLSRGASSYDIIVSAYLNLLRARLS